MIGRLAGTLVEANASMLLIDVTGVAYEVEVSAGVLHTLPCVGEDLTLYTHFVVREDAQLLYGFNTRHERDLFRAFIKINGVGPKLGLSLISSLDLQTLAAAVRSNDVSLLTKVPGVGKKTAERLMVELKNRLDALAESGAVPVNIVSVDGVSVDVPPNVAGEAEDALIALGYRPQEAGRAVSQALQDSAHGVASAGDSQALSAQTLVRLALRTFARTSTR